MKTGWNVRCGAVAVIAVLAGCGTSDRAGDVSSSPTATATADTTRDIRATTSAPLTDWPMFGITSARSSATDRPTGITAGNVGGLERRQVSLPGTVDSSPVIFRGFTYVTTTYGKTLAVDLASGAVRWVFTPPGYDGWKRTAQITNASPTIDPGGRTIFTASPDGKLHKLSLADGREQHGFPVTLTKDPTHEKLASSINVSGSEVIEPTGGYIGDAPPYQGHVVTVDRSSGKIRGVFNSLCSDRHEIFQPSTCPGSDSAIWGRAGVVVLPGSRDLLAATSNGPFDGKTNWGDSVLRLDPTGAHLKAHWTPAQQKQYEEQDVDVGSTSPALLGGDLIMQSGKDSLLHLLSLKRLYGASGAAGRRLGGDLQVLPTPGKTLTFSAPAVWHHHNRTTMFATTGGGTAAYALIGRKLKQIWGNAHAGTSPAVAGGLLYVYDPTGGGLRVFTPTTGRTVATLPAGDGHWNSPAIADGHIVLPEGNANDHKTTGVLDIWTPPNP